MISQTIKKIAVVLIFLFTFISVDTYAAGVGKWTVQSGRPTVYVFTWTSDASGNVSYAAGVEKISIAGVLQGVEFVAAVAPDVPTDLYDVQLLSSSGDDILMTLGANVPILTTSTARRRTPRTTDQGSVLLRPGEIITPSITNAGNVKKGTIYLYVW